jgi:sulfite exporter TauE/SafE
MIDAAQAAAAVGIGLAGAGHCLGMCGGIAAGLSLAGQQSTAGTLAYHAGRLLGYTLLGAALAGLAASVNIAQWTIALRYFAGLLLVAMGLYIGNWWRGLVVLERGGALLWRPVQKLAGGLLPLRHWSHALPLGLAWGLMPCGLIYSALAWSATSGSAVEGGLLMLLFGAGTLPAMLTTSFAAARTRAMLQRPALQRVIALLLIAAGLWGIYATWQHSAHLLHPVGGSGAMPAHEHHAPAG